MAIGNDDPTAILSRDGSLVVCIGDSKDPGRSAEFYVYLVCISSRTSTTEAGADVL